MFSLFIIKQLYLNESVKSLISICGLMRSYNILYMASFGYLFHLYLRTLHAVAFAYHRTKGAVA